MTIGKAKYRKVNSIIWILHVIDISDILCALKRSSNNSVLEIKREKYSKASGSMFNHIYQHFIDYIHAS